MRPGPGPGIPQTDGHLAEPAEVTDRLGPNDDPFNPQIKQLFDRLFIPQTASDLHVEIRMGNNLGNGARIDRRSGLGPV